MMATGIPRRPNLRNSERNSSARLRVSRRACSLSGAVLPGTFTPDFSTQFSRRNSSISRSLMRYRSALPFFTLKSGGCAMNRCPASMTWTMWRKKKVSRSVRIWAPSTSASVMRMTL